jgi:hypothetical protein
LEDSYDIKEEEPDDREQQDDVNAWANQNKVTQAL